MAGTLTLHRVVARIKVLVSAPCRCAGPFSVVEGLILYTCCTSPMTTVSVQVTLQLASTASVLLSQRCCRFAGLLAITATTDPLLSMLMCLQHR